MKPEAILEFRYVVISRFACVVGGVDADAEVKAEDEELEVVAKTEACAEGEVAEEVTG